MRKQSKTQSYHARLVRCDKSSRDLGAELSLPSRRRDSAKLVIGRREWVGLPEFGIGPLNAKTDSGARSSSLHAEDIELSNDGERVTFSTRDHYGRIAVCEAKVGGLSKVKSSTGVATQRIWIETEAVIAGGFRWRVRFTLAGREKMTCPMLLGRRALSGNFLIDTQSDHLNGGADTLDLRPV